MLLVACDRSSERAFQRQVRYAPSAPLWSTSGDRVFAEADIASALVIDSTIIILESSATRLTGVDMSSWRQQWSTGRRGDGPGEFQVPRTLVAIGPQQFGVLDSFGARLQIFDAHGAFTRSVSGALYAREVDDICVLSSNAMLASRFPHGELVRVDSTGRTTQQADMQWPERRLDAAIQLKQARFARQRTSRPVCVLHTVRGNYYAEIDSATLAPREIRLYGEQVAVPEVVLSNGAPSLPTDVVTGTYAVVTDSLLYVLYGGTGPLSERQVDSYDRRTGAYQWSIRLPLPARQFDVIGARLLVLEVGGNDIKQVSMYALHSEEL